MTGSYLKGITEGERTQCCISTRATACNRESVAINITPLDEIVRAVDAVVNIDDAPLTIEAFAIWTPIACTPAVVHIENGKAATRPELDFEVELACGRTGWATMTHDKQGR